MEKTIKVIEKLGSKMLDISKLSKVKHQGNNIIAQCPACAETGHDQKGNHLFVASTGAFGCVVNAGGKGGNHYQRIFALVGIKENSFTKNDKVSLHPRTGSLMKIKPAEKHKPLVIEKNVLGHLGHVNETHTRKESITKPADFSLKSSLVNAVPNVPKLPRRFFSEKLELHFVSKDGCIHFEDGIIYTHEEMVKLKDIDDESLKKIHEIKRTFNGTVDSVT